MLWALRAVMFLVLVGIGASVMVALARLLLRRWMEGLKLFALAIVGFLAAGVAMAPLGVFYVRSLAQAAKLDPAEKARLLGEAIATQMSYAMVGFPIGLVLGGLVAWQRRSSPPTIRGAL